MSSGYVNPLARAHVTPERIDMGVDYAGTGNYVAIGNGVVTQVNPGGWGQYGNYMEYQLTDGPNRGQYVFYAEGITPSVRVGQRITAGQVVASLIPGWHSGTEIGWGSGRTNTTYAAAFGGGYTEGARTAAGQSFSDFVRSLGGYPGVTGSQPVTGTAPHGVTTAVAQGGGGILGSGIGPNVGPDLNPLDAITNIFNSIVSHAKYAAIALVVIVGGFVLVGKGVSRATHAEGAPA